MEPEISASAPLPVRHGSRRVTLNVGGHRFETFIDTFMKFPDSLLGRMFSQENAELCKPDEKNEYFIDRNGRAFEAILDFYRTGLLIAPKNVSLRSFKEEVQFYQLPLDCEVSEADQPWGQRVRAYAMQNAYDNAKDIVSKVVKVVESAVNEAANHGCFLCKIDIMPRDAFLRTARGLIKEPGTDPDIPHATGRWHSNLVDENVSNFLHSEVNRLFLQAYLRQEGLDITLKPERSFFVVKVRLFKLKPDKN